MWPAVCNPLLLPPRGFARARLLLPWSGAHSVHARGGLICGEHSWHEVLHCCPMPAHHPVRKQCSRPVRPQVLDAAGLAHRSLADSLLLIRVALPIWLKELVSGQSDPHGRSGCGQRPAGDVPRWIGAGGGGGASVGGLWARSGRDRRATPVQLDESQQKSGPPLSHDIYIILMCLSGRNHYYHIPRGYEQRNGSGRRQGRRQGRAGSRYSVSTFDTYIPWLTVRPDFDPISAVFRHFRNKTIRDCRDLRLESPAEGRDLDLSPGQASATWRDLDSSPGRSDWTWT